MNLYIADTHFGHANAIRFDNRPFADPEEMDAEIHWVGERLRKNQPWLKVTLQRGNSKDTT